jgi:hypothetical protein
MRSVVFAVFVVLSLLMAGRAGASSGSFSALPAPVAAQDEEATPTAPAEVCSPEEIAAGEALNSPPPGETDGVVPPFAPGATGSKVLYIAVVTLPEDSCLPYRFRDGAVVLFVQEGTIEYTATADAADPDPDLTIEMGDSDEDPADTVEVDLDETVTLEANEWLTQDNGVWFTFRNAGAGDAVVSVAVYADDPWNDDTCTGGCRKP